MWVQPRMFKRRYELRRGAATCAFLRWENLWGTRLSGETAEARWTLRWAGFRPRMIVRAAGADAAAAVLALGWGFPRGTLKLASGGEVEWTRASFWRSQWSFTDKAGQALVVFRPRGWGIRFRAEVEVIRKASGLPELALLALVGGYLTVLNRDLGYA